MALIETHRTTLRELTLDDAPFIAQLLNEPAFLRYIGDRGVRTTDDAAAFIESRYRQSYRDHGYGLYHVALRETGASIGICGFVRRDGLDHPDLGFALTPAAEGRGLAFEAAEATLEYGWRGLGLPTVLAVVQPDNIRSQRLLGRLGFAPAGDVTLPGSQELLDLFRWLAPG